MGDFKKLKEGMVHVYNNYVENSSSKGGTEEGFHEFETQRKFYESAIGNVKSKLNKANQCHKQENHRIMKENVELLNELNGLRKEYKKLLNMKK
jgi:pectate lyase